MRRAVSKRPDPQDGPSPKHRPCPSAKAKQKNRNSGEAKNVDAKQAQSDPDKRDGAAEESAQPPIHATLIGSDHCEAEGITASGRAPVLDLCRNFVEAGNDPNRRAALFNPTQNNCSKEARDERQG